ncbi:carboxypeptidase M32 [Enterovibrio sp. ZSDZ42]|uniref:Metal-dependent carboxypeptidase n=1 Tax=Enterovibrio gelatinilyticus TaxID=2899819 RepID=A0ABT5QUM8_9GAMM|nr:carboxypeptidase M32 [Enterovibrio sp. ZSDZ42]MDD1791717.1 carboxypeptidase M32 [Enterovibrio sp. ZSDZ42]
MKAIEKLEKQFQKLASYEHLAAICGWDQAAMMPSGGNEARSHAMSDLAVLCHETLTDPNMSTWIKEAERDTETLTDEQVINLREIKRVWTQATQLPSELVEKKSLIGSKCEHEWRSQRTNNDWNGFAENLKKVVEAAREEANTRAGLTGMRPYDAMLDLYEPGMTTEKLDVLFGELKTWLPALIQQVLDKQSSVKLNEPNGPFETDKQAALGKQMMQILGFDFNHGRLDVSTHPFCGGVPTDVRITTRYDEQDFTSALMGVVHETGHARYEQGLPKAYHGFPAGEARSMGIHESQSLFFEMQMGRNPLFVDHLAKLSAEAFNKQDDAAFSRENINALYQRVRPGYIRVDADEVTYPAHIILRFEIERDLVEGKIEVEDIPTLWNEKMQEYLGLTTDGEYTNGCMQDIHWTDGSFGYFPSYTLGAMYAAQFMAAMRKTVDVDACIEALDFAPISAWLEANIWSKGSTLTTDELVIQATGEPLNPEYFKQHLIDRYLNN